MNQFSGRYGLGYTAANADAVNAFDHTVSGYLGFTRDIGDRLKEVFGHDAEMPMAHIAKGYFFKLFGTAVMAERADKAFADATRLLEGVDGGNARERHHFDALRCWCAGDLDGATAAWEAILIDHPKDAFALRLAHFNHFYAGEGRLMRDSVARVLPEWDEDDPDLGFVLGMYAFGNEEAGDYATAERFGRRAVALNPADAWSVHAVAHVMEMQGRHTEGIRWVSGLEESWSTTNNFRFHLYWHRALYHLEREEFDVVFDLYDRYVASDIETDMYLDICNAAALLWRLEMYGRDVGSRWRDLVVVSLKHVEDHELIFVSLHYLMVLLKSGERDAAQRMAEQFRAYSNGTTTQGRVTAAVGLATADAMEAMARGDAAAVVDALYPVRAQMYRMGGSHAQRDVWEEMLVDAATRANPKIARALLAERTRAKPNSAWSWRKYADALQATGAAEKAAAARAQSDALLSAV
jgi:tetratricopeptide (TPR) repeat protein